jgi:DNA-binding FadR family transcriptional regulator
MPRVRASKHHPDLTQGDASERIAVEIRRFLARKSLRPGDRLGTEQELATEFGVSRPTLREALRLLSSSQLIRASRGPGGGIFVASTPNEGMSRSLSKSIATLLETESLSLGDLVEARLHLEVPLARLAAKNATTDTFLKLEAAIADAEPHHAQSEEFSRADVCFHRTIAHAAGNELLSAFTSWTLDVVQPTLIAAVGDALDGPLILSQHRAILRAIRRHQPAAAELAMRRHLEYLAQQVRALEVCPDL